MAVAAPFASERLRMRALSPNDARALYSAYADQATMRYWSSPPHATLAETIAYLTVADEQGNRYWTITLADGAAPVGTVTALTRRTGVVEIGYLLAPAHRGRGYAREAVTALLDLLFGEGNRRVFADTDPENVASIALLEALGFRREGLLRAEWETHIGIRDTLLLGLLRDEWLSSSAATRAGATYSTLPPAPRRAPG